MILLGLCFLGAAQDDACKDTTKTTHIMLYLDHSLSVNDADWNLSIEFAQKYLEHPQVQSNDTQLAISEFRNNAIYPLHGFSTNSTSLNASLEVERVRDRRVERDYITQFPMTNVFMHAKTALGNVTTPVTRPIVVMVTDTESYEEMPPRGATEMARDELVKTRDDAAVALQNVSSIVIVRVGSQNTPGYVYVKEEVLQNWTSKGALIDVTSYSEIASHFSKTIAVACPPTTTEKPETPKAAEPDDENIFLKYILPAIIGAFLLCCCCLVCFIAWRKKKEKDTEETLKRQDAAKLVEATKLEQTTSPSGISESEAGTTAMVTPAVKPKREPRERLGPPREGKTPRAGTEKMARERGGKRENAKGNGKGRRPALASKKPAME